MRRRQVVVEILWVYELTWNRGSGQNIINPKTQNWKFAIEFYRDFHRQLQTLKLICSPTLLLRRSISVCGEFPGDQNSLVKLAASIAVLALWVFLNLIYTWKCDSTISLSLTNARLPFIAGYVEAWRLYKLSYCSSKWDEWLLRYLQFIENGMQQQLLPHKKLQKASYADFHNF